MNGAIRSSEREGFGLGPRKEEQRLGTQNSIAMIRRRIDRSWSGKLVETPVGAGRKRKEMVGGGPVTRASFGTVTGG